MNQETLEMIGQRVQETQQAIEALVKGKLEIRKKQESATSDFIHGSISKAEYDKTLSHLGKAFAKNVEIQERLQSVLEDLKNQLLAEKEITEQALDRLQKKTIDRSNIPDWGTFG